MMRVLAIGAHPDDIELGCGGTLAKLSKRGCELSFCILTRGERGGCPAIRQLEQEDSCRMFCAKRLIWCNFPDAQVRNDRRVVESLRQAIREASPHLILIHHHDDLHQDHESVSAATIAAASKGQNIVFYEGPSTQNFNPTLFIDIESTLEEKIEGVERHRSQVERFGKSFRVGLIDFVETTAQFRGRQSFLKYAEGFVPYSIYDFQVLNYLTGSRNAEPARRNNLSPDFAAQDR